MTQGQSGERKQRLMLRMEFSGGAFMAFFPPDLSADDLTDIEDGWAILIKSMRRRLAGAPTPSNESNTEGEK